MTEFEAKAVLDSINRMFKSNHFSICDVDKCMKVTGAVRTSSYRAINLYHCVNFSEMDKETKQFLFKATIENVCNVDEFPEIHLHKPSDTMAGLTVLETRKPLLQRLFGS